MKTEKEIWSAMMEARKRRVRALNMEDQAVARYQEEVLLWVLGRESSFSTTLRIK